MYVYIYIGMCVYVGLKNKIAITKTIGLNRVINRF